MGSCISPATESDPPFKSKELRLEESQATTVNSPASQQVRPAAIASCHPAWELHQRSCRASIFMKSTLRVWHMYDINVIICILFHNLILEKKLGRQQKHHVGNFERAKY